MSDLDKTTNGVQPLEDKGSDKGTVLVNNPQNGWMSEQQIKEAQSRHSRLYNGAPLFIPECCKKH